jgi:hypothetical protein
MFCGSGRGTVSNSTAQLVEALRYRPESRGFDSLWCHWNFSLTLSFRSHYGPGVDSVSNKCVPGMLSGG